MRALDRTDLRLLLELTDDPRAPTVPLAQRLSVTRNTVQARLTSLEASGVLLPYDRCINEAAIVASAVCASTDPGSTARAARTAALASRKAVSWSTSPRR